MTREGGGSLSQNIAEGGRSLLYRQIAVMVLAFVGVVVVTRLIGPASYGVYAAAFGIAFLAQTWGEFNLDVYMVRHEGELGHHICHQVFTLLLVSAVLTTGALLVLLFLGPLGSLVDSAEYRDVALAMFVGVPLVHLQQVPLSLLERDLDYGRIGLIEVVAQVAFVAGGTGLAFSGAGVWALVVAWYLQQSVHLIGYWACASYRPRLTWDADVVRSLLRFGSTATSATVAYSARNLVAPVVVGGMLGAAALGYVTLATRLLEQVSFARNIITRMSYAVMGKVAGDARRLQVALTRAMEAQVLAVGLPVSLLSFASPYVIPFVFGESWRPIVQVVPLLVPGVLVVAMFSVHVAVLVGRTFPWEVVLVNVLNGAAMWILALLLVPAVGLSGYAYAEMISVLAWALLGVLYGRRHVSPDYRYAVLWIVALTMVALASTVSIWLLPVGLLLAVNPMTVRRVRASSGPFLRRSTQA